MPPEGQRGLNDAESALIYDLYNIGQTKDQIGKFFNVTSFTITNHITKQRKLRGDPVYSLKEMSDVLVRFTLTSLARNLPKLSMEQQLRFLPDLLKIQGEHQGETSDSKTHLYLPQKDREVQKGTSSSNDEAGGGDEAGG
jgi:hypothetical protein